VICLPARIVHLTGYVTLHHQISLLGAQGKSGFGHLEFLRQSCHSLRKNLVVHLRLTGRTLSWQGLICMNLERWLVLSLFILSEMHSYVSWSSVLGLNLLEKLHAMADLLGSRHLE